MDYKWPLGGCGGHGQGGSICVPWEYPKGQIARVPACRAASAGGGAVRALSQPVITMMQVQLANL